MAAVETRFRVMGSEAHVVVTNGRPRHLRQVRRILEHLECRWSRFLVDSDITRLNSLRGKPVRVHEHTIRLLEVSRLASKLTGGRFDPTVLDSVVARGYRQSLDLETPVPQQAVVGYVAGMNDVHIDRKRSTARFEAGLGFDPSGIGKGLAADMAVEGLLADGVAGALVGIGGDVRVAGVSPQGGPWTVAVEEPHDPTATRAVIHVSDGGVATSTARHGRWSIDGEGVLHMIDPSTGAVSETDAAAVTVVAGEGWTAEVVATAAVVAGVEHGLELVRSLGLDCLIVDHSGRLHGTTRMAVPA